MQAQVLPFLARPCRIVTRRRYPPSFVSQARNFHAYPRLGSSAPQDPPNSADSSSTSVANEYPAADATGNTENEGSPSGSTPPASRFAKKDTGPYGSGVRRAMRNRKQPKQWALPAAKVPTWFCERNTIFHDTDQQHQRDAMRQVRIEKNASKSEKVLSEESGRSGDGGEQPESQDRLEAETRYAVEEAVWEELLASVKAGLKLPPTKYANDPSVIKSHLVLQYPEPDGILFLDALVKRVGHEIEADIVILNAQDIAELCSEQDLTGGGTTSPIRFLGYEIYRPSSTSVRQELEEDMNDVDEDSSDALGDSDSSRDPRPSMARPKFITIESPRVGAGIPIPGWLGLKGIVASFNGTSDQSATSAGNATPAEHPWARLVDALIIPSGRSGPPAVSRENEPILDFNKTKDVLHKEERDLIIQVQDYKDIQRTREGFKFLSLLQQAIQNRRKAGKRVLLIETEASHVDPTAQDTSVLSPVNLDDQFSNKIIVIIPALDSHVAEKILTEDRKRHTMEVNVRHLQEMVRTRLGDQSPTMQKEILSTRDWSLSTSIIEQSGLEDRYWTYDQVHRVVTLALGSMEANEAFSLLHIQRGIELMRTTDRVKAQWMKQKLSSGNASGHGNDRERLLKSLLPTCNWYEKKLLNGVVDAKSIRTTFADVHVPPETIDALKTLTSLSLIRPEAFTYGVLATDKISGLLLYGPPGTGKTLLVKAVARESGATVLEVSGSEVYDMYVGEGEKNVKAIFTLAKKLSPCVVFIDEADAIFGSRTGLGSRTSHREMINQFLREWDGMDDLSAFVMVATNRPFDLDDAVLRRLPRRLLVDLPTEQDRLAILKIHLKDETLDPSVDLAELAHRTPFYSGSDLKNLCVAAALASVREENDLAAQHQGQDPYRYPERRILTWPHFQRGMEEISASISEDMSSLSAIRKFDEQYGDRKGRRKRSPAWGFNSPGGDEVLADAARVRA